MINSLVVMGLGYIGLPTAAMFASAGVRVLGVDVNTQAVETVNQGKIHIVEPGLEELVSKVVSEGLLVASTEPKTADAYIIAVPTPFESNNIDIPNPDLSFIKSAAEALAPVLKVGDLIILESTSPVGTTHMITELLEELRTDLNFPRDGAANSDINIAYCPERVLPGAILQELRRNSRVIGGISIECSKRAQDAYKIFVESECFLTDAKTAEMVKLTENASRDVQIAFANELSLLCDQFDVNVWELIGLANQHPRVNILQPGPGVGGHCIAVDPWFLISASPDTAKLMHAARQINDNKPKWVEDKVHKAVDELVSKTGESRDTITIACYGLAFKANIDDLRESPALKITKSLSENHSGKVIAVEPNIDELDITNVELVDINTALEIAQIHLVLVEHEEFLNLQISDGFVLDMKGITR